MPLQLFRSHARSTTLGQPIGSHQFAQQFLCKQAEIFNHTVLNQLTTKLENKQTQGSMLRNCALPTLTHLCAADAHHNADLTTPQPLHNWSSKFTNHVQQTVHTFLCTQTQQQTMPNESTTIFYLPTSQGGCGFRKPSTCAIPSLVIPLARSLRHALSGFQLSNGNACKLPHMHTTALASWAKSTQRVHQIFRHFATEICPLLPDNSQQQLPDLNAFVLQTPLKGLQSHLHQTHQQPMRQELLLATNPDFKDALPSILSPLTSLPLHSLSRQSHDSRLTNEQCTIMLQRKLRLPLLPQFLRDTPCECGHNILDHFGDHFFQCKKANKNAPTTPYETPSATFCVDLHLLRKRCVSPRTSNWRLPDSYPN